MNRRSQVVRRFAAAVIALTAAVASLVGVRRLRPSRPEAPLGAETIAIGYQLIPNGDLVVKNQRLLEKAFGPDVEGRVEAVRLRRRRSTRPSSAAASTSAWPASSPVSRGLSTGIEYQVPWIFDVIGYGRGTRRQARHRHRSPTSRARRSPRRSRRPRTTACSPRSQDAGLKTGDVKVIDAEPDVDRRGMDGRQDRRRLRVEPEPGRADQGRRDHADRQRGAGAKTGKTTYDLAVVSTEFARSTRGGPDVGRRAGRGRRAAPGQETRRPSRPSPSELNISVADAKEQTSGLVYVRATDQAGEEYLGGGAADQPVRGGQVQQGLGRDPVRGQPSRSTARHRCRRSLRR